MEFIRSNIDYKFIFMIILIVSMINNLSLISLILWAVGVSLTCTLTDRKGIGMNLLNNTKRRILLGIGMTLTIISLLNEIDTISYVFFAVGFFLTIVSIELSNKKRD